MVGRKDRRIDELEMKMNDILKYLDYTTEVMNNQISYIEFIQPTNSISYKHWCDVKDDPEELVRIKRDNTINEIIK